MRLAIDEEANALLNRAGNRQSRCYAVESLNGLLTIINNDSDEIIQVVPGIDSVLFELSYDEACQLLDDMGGEIKYTRKDIEPVSTIFAGIHTNGINRYDDVELLKQGNQYSLNCGDISIIATRAGWSRWLHNIEMTFTNLTSANNGADLVAVL